MTSTEAHNLLGTTDDGSNDSIPRGFTRSPHPYHRRGPSLLGAESDEDNPRSISRPESTGLLTPRLSSESGTEADDEGGQALKRLPAPPLKPSKGLRDSAGKYKNDISPLPTPSFSDDRSLPPTSDSAIDTSRPLRREDRERWKLQARRTRRRRGEIVRRLTELGLLSAVCAVVCVRRDVSTKLSDWYQELAAFVGTALFLYLAYPVRLLLRMGTANIRQLQVPATFDPAPLLYPVFLPFLVAASLLPVSITFLLPNLVLGLSSLPKPCITFNKQTSIFSHTQWIIAILPLVLSQNSLTEINPSRPLALKTTPNNKLDPEVLVLLYPLHVYLVMTLKYLTTTSLDESELHLLSTILLNLFMFAESPQMEILKSLLWLGGLGIFCLCSRVLEWEVALARLPSWRLRRNERKSSPRRQILESLDVGICDRLIGAAASRSRADDSSDEDSPVRPSDKLFNLLKVRTDDSSLGYRAVEKLGPLSAVDGLHKRVKSFEPSQFFRRNRRHTFSTMADTAQETNRNQTSTGRQKRKVAPNLQPFLSFTPAQALVRKWMYAAYTYAVTLLLILGPIRRYVSAKALNGDEPFGWAIGYLFGNIPAVRFWVVMSNTNDWIHLPDLMAIEGQASRDSTALDHIRSNIGQANTRLVLCVYCLCVLATGIGIVLRLSSVVEVDTRRKVFHGIMVAMLIPTILVDPCFVALALALVLAIFLMLDLFRASQLPPISQPLTLFLAPYVDGRDYRGPVIVSHIFLLIGCAIPLWLSMAGAARGGDDPWQGWDMASRDISMVSGVLCVGLGDAAASLVGRRYGRHKWYWPGGKSLEGSLAFVVAVTIGLLTTYTFLIVGAWKGHEESWLKLVAKCGGAAAGASLTEAVLTGANDNVVVPVILWLLVRGLQI